MIFNQFFTGNSKPNIISSSIQESVDNNQNDADIDSKNSEDIIIFGQQNNFSRSYFKPTFNGFPTTDFFSNSDSNSNNNSSSQLVYGHQVNSLTAETRNLNEMKLEHETSNFEKLFKNSNENSHGVIKMGMEGSSSASGTGSSGSGFGSGSGSDGVITQNTNQDKNALLMKNFQRFLQVLKSQNSGGGSSSGGGGGNSHFNFNFDSDNDKLSRATMGLDSSSSPIEGKYGNGIVGIVDDDNNNMKFSFSNDLNFNMSLDAIEDLNNLMGDYKDDSMSVKHILIILSYFIIACVAIIGNLLVVQLVIRSRRLHTLTHALLANLAVADLLMASLNIPFSAARVIMTEWPFGSFLCHVVPFVQVTSVYVTSITMAVIAIDRYQVIVNPLGRRMKNSQAIVLVILIWTLSAFLSLPYALYHKVVVILTFRVVKRCQADFTPVARRWLTVATFLGQYFAPIFLTTTSYISIMLRLGLRTSVMGSTTPRQVAAQSRAKRTTIKMLVLTVIFFTLCWAPINAYHLLTHFNLVSHNSTAILLCHIIAMSSTCYNPFIYCWLNEHFRREAIKWFCFFRRGRSSRRSRSNSTILELKSMGMMCAHNNSPSSRNHCINNSGSRDCQRNNSNFNGNGNCSTNTN